MYCFQLACLAEAYGTTFECDIEDAEFIIVNVQDIRHKSDNQCFDDLGDLYDFVSAHGKAIHVVEFGADEIQPTTSCLPGLYAAVEAVFAKSGQSFP